MKFFGSKHRARLARVTRRGLVFAATFGVLAAPLGVQAQQPDACSTIARQPDQIEGMSSYVYRTASGRDLRIHLAMPEGASSKRPAVLFFFGGGWTIGNIEDFAGRARDFAKHGYVAAVADYRVFCRDHTGPSDSLVDARAAYSWLRDHAKQFGIDDRRVVVSGGSAGGHLALMTALQADPRSEPVALVLYNPAVDLVGFGKRFGLSDDEARAISPVRQDLRHLPPTIIFHGRADRSVPIQMVRDFCTTARAQGAACEVREYEGQDHGFFHSHVTDPHVGRSPYEDTLAGSLDFLVARHVTVASH